MGIFFIAAGLVAFIGTTHDNTCVPLNLDFKHCVEYVKDNSTMPAGPYNK